MIELEPDIIKTNILTKFEKDSVKTVAARVPTRFFKDLTRPYITKTIILGKFEEDWAKNVTSRV